MSYYLIKFFHQLDRVFILLLLLLLLLLFSFFIVEDPYDYLGRSYLHIPQDEDVDLRTDEPPKQCYAPKKLIYSW